MKQKFYACPVCGFEGLQELPFGANGEPSHEICACCGFEFGFDGVTPGEMTEFRQKWLKNDAPWFNAKRRPANWNLEHQLKNLSKTS